MQAVRPRGGYRRGAVQDHHEVHHGPHREGQAAGEPGKSLSPAQCCRLVRKSGKIENAT